MTNNVLHLSIAIHNGTTKTGEITARNQRTRMKFQLRPILSEMKEFYLKPLSTKRFEDYLTKLQGGTWGDLKLPISGFNPMAKEHIIGKIEELENLEAESIMEQAIQEVNSSLAANHDVEFQVVLNLADDYKGGWTNFYSTDYESKFKIRGLVDRNFCTPYFWTSENYTENLIRLRTKEYLNRTLYWLNNSNPVSLKEHIDQEVNVAMSTIDKLVPEDSLKDETIENFYRENQNSEDHSLIFNFLYGDVASESLGYKQYGLIANAGFSLAKNIALNRKAAN